MQRPFRKLLFTVIGLLLLVVGSLSLLTASEPGSRWLVRQALTLAPGELQIAGIHGRLITGLTLETISYRLDQTTL
jgi:translocation and assembly module TamB